jgi:hypothetical protein
MINSLYLKNSLNTKAPRNHKEHKERLSQSLFFYLCVLCVRFVTLCSVFFFSFAALEIAQVNKTSENKPVHRRVILTTAKFDLTCTC